MEIRADSSFSRLTDRKDCFGLLVCPHCGDAVMCSNVPPNHVIHSGDAMTEEESKQMDLSKEVSGKEPRQFEKRDWLTAEDLPSKGSKKWKVDGTRDAKKNKTGILIYVDLSAGKLKRVMSLRKNFTLDMFVAELGTNSDKWTGKSIDLERGGSEGQYVNVSQ
jgi:hypothetical protein